MTDTRERLAGKRPCETIKITHGRRAVFVSVSRYPDGRPSEIFIDTAKAGTELKGIMHALAMSTSLALQHGCPMQEIVDALNNFNPGELPRSIGGALSELVGVPL